MARAFRPKEETVADFLREGIISGRYARGERLKQQEIADLLQTSITPVREALKLLEAEGYVTADNYRGATVAPFDIEASREVLELRILLETKLVRCAVEKATSEDIAELKVLAAEFARAFDAGDNEAARAANYRFHHRMFEIAAMPQTLHFVQILWARYPFDLINRLKGRVTRAAEEHDDMLGAIIAGDAAAAMLATRQHIEAGWQELRDSLQAETTPPQAESERSDA
ncbi:MAG: GntR family transcriptional regulator [Novosphingobium sp.]|nr:GntR family transcriptional regulator [Novosphingobium sp.]MCP5404222.1 GntR family transcriptional regulator [Novosphingobium sp.]